MATRKPSKEIDLESLIQVTDVNRKFAIVMGRKLLAIEKTGTTKKTVVMLGSFEIRPRIKAGWNDFGGNKFYAQQDEDKSEYAESFRSVINLLIKEGKLFFNPKTRLIKYK
jgi:hypothetical protein